MYTQIGVLVVMLTVRVVEINGKHRVVVAMYIVTQLNDYTLMALQSTKAIS